MLSKDQKVLSGHYVLKLKYHSQIYGAFPRETVFVNRNKFLIRNAILTFYEGKMEIRSCNNQNNIFVSGPQILLEEVFVLYHSDENGNEVTVMHSSSQYREKRNTDEQHIYHPSFQTKEYNEGRLLWFTLLVSLIILCGIGFLAYIWH